MAKKPEEKSKTEKVHPAPKKTRTAPKKTSKPPTTLEKTPVIEKPPVVHEPSIDNESIPSMTVEQTQAYMQFSEACKGVYEKFSTEKIDDRVTQLKSSPALISVVRFMVMLHDLLRMYGVMKFNKNVSPTLYKYLDDIQEKTGQKLPLARVLLDGIKTTKMELLSGVTVHPLPEFKEPEYEIVPIRRPHPFDSADEEFENQGNPGGKHEDPLEETSETSSQEAPQGHSNVGPGGPFMDENVQPQSGIPVDQPVNPPTSVDEEEED